MQITILQAFSYLCLLVFVVKTIMVWRRYAGMPRHLRWELHPTPREEVSHNRNLEEGGGASTILAEVCYAAREGLLFQQCFKSNKSLWYVTYPFHLGVFLSSLWFVLLFLRTPFGAVDFRWPARVLDIAIIFSGAVGLILGTVGCMGLLVKRLFDPGLSVYTSLREYLNLCVILLMFVFGLATWIGPDRDFALSRAYVYSLVTLSAPPGVDWLFGAAIVLLSAFIAFLPFGSLRHGIAKFFTYHRVRWDDEPNIRGGELEAIIQSQLNRRMTWQAPHARCGRWRNIGDTEKAETGELQ
jgi:nitrate reductase gamma subunit